MEAFGDLLRLIFFGGVLAVLGGVVGITVAFTIVLLVTGKKDQRPSDLDDHP